MSERRRSLLIVVAMLAMAATTALLVVTSPTEASRVERLGAAIRCPVCQGEAIIDSPARMARDMMDLVEERVTAGLSDEQIVDEILDAYSGSVLLDPEPRGAGLLLWLAPVGALVAGVALVVWWHRHPAEAFAEVGTTKPRSRARMVTGGLILALVFAAVVALAGASLQDRVGAATGVADLQGEDLSEISNATMEAVISANESHPQIDGMRLALADRYFEAGDYRAAFPLYLDVAQSTLATRPQVATALTALGWMAWDGNGESETALQLFDEALAVDPGSHTTLYLRGRVLWCDGASDAEVAGIFSDLLADPGLPESSRQAVSDDLAALERGEACR